MPAPENAHKAMVAKSGRPCAQQSDASTLIPKPRHTNAYHLKNHGIHVITAQKLMGHPDHKGARKIYMYMPHDEINNIGAILAMIS